MLSLKIVFKCLGRVKELCKSFLKRKRVIQIYYIFVFKKLLSRHNHNCQQLCKALLKKSNPMKDA